MGNRFRVSVVLVSTLLLFGCTKSNTLYHWGHYEDAIYAMYLEPGQVATEDEINRLEEQIEKTVFSGEFVPPGLHAHLAYLYFSEGDYATGMIHLQTEKEKFPESAHFIDGIIERMKK